MRRFVLSGIAASGIIVCAVCSAASAETIFGALSKAYENNAELNSARAGVRVADENVPLAKSGYRPRVTGTAGITNASTTGRNDSRGLTTVSFGIEVNQSIFDGFRTRNSIEGAEARVRAERENLRNTEQNVLFDTAQAFMDVLQNRQIANLRARNLEFLQEQLRSASARFDVGEGTRTDVAQAEAALASADAALTAAQASVGSSQAVYRQLTGADPKDLKSADAITKLLPKTLDGAYSTAFSNHPAIKLRDALVDSQLLSVKVAEGAFLPTVGLSASITNTNTFQDETRRGSLLIDDGTNASTSASVGIRATIPIYPGGEASATVRQRKEQLGQARIDIDVARDQVRAAVASSWTQLETSRALVSANQETVRAARLALNGVVEERNVGQRTTLDVLNAQEDVLTVQINLVQSQRNLVVSSYALASAIGKLSAASLGLNVAQHNPKEHYHAVKDKWFGLRTPDGR